MPRKLLVTVTLRERVLQQHAFEQSCVKIGRHRACDLVIDNPAISRVHAEIVATDSGFMLLDKGSANGMQLNGAAAAETALKDGDVLTLGKFTLYVAIPTENADRDGALSGRDVTIRSPSESPR